MISKRTLLLSMVLSLVLVSTLGVVLRPAHKAAAACAGSPTSEKWSVYSMPYLEPGYQSNPVVVKTVTTEADKRLTITKVGILSREREVRSVKLKWYVSNAANPGNILQQGETSEISIEGGLAAGELRQIQFPVVSFLDVVDQMKKAGMTLQGDYKIDVAVSEVKFSSGRPWSNQSRSKLEYMNFARPAIESAKLADNVHTAHGGTAPQSCSPTYTACAYHYTGSCPPGCISSTCCTNGGYYDCGSYNPAPVSCQANGTSCTTVYCG